MTQLIHSVIRYGVPLVFLNVFLEQIGAPVPALPTLIVAGALSADGRMSSTHVLVASIVASLIADWIWFLLGRRHGYRVLRTLCRISLSPDSCVRETEARFERWGLKSLLIAKFIPGFSLVAPPLAGAARQSTIAFLIYDGIGALLWVASGVVVGRAFHHAIADVLNALENLGWWAVAIIASAIALLIALKWMQRRSLYRRLRMARVSVHDLKRMLDEGSAPMIVDARSSAARKRDARRIPTAVVVEGDTLQERFAALPPNREIIVYCT
jgi:membrane protein DedA with SNARE-associated domain